MDELNPAQLQALGERLEQARLALLRQLEDDLHRDTDLRAPAPHEAEASPADNASQRTLAELTHEAAEHSSHQLQRVRQALTRLQDGSYGYCVQCGVAIGYSRLEARPEAPYCIACQMRLEQGRR